MPRIIRVGLKTGVLPKPRQVVPRLKTPLELAEEAKIPSGFSDPAMAPRGSPANPPSRHEKTAAEKIAASARAPKSNDVNSASPEALWKREVAEVRRTYFESSLRAYEAAEKRHMQARAKRQSAAQAQERTGADVVDSRATMLTAPTVESALYASQIQPRTPEEEKELRLKREYNRKLTERNVLARQQEQLAVLYEQASSFIVSEQQLEDRVSEVFKEAASWPATGTQDTQTPVWWRYVNAAAASRGGPARAEDVRLQERETAVNEALNGTVKVTDPDAARTGARYLPGLKEIRKALRD